MIYYYACVTSYTVAERAAAGADAAGRVRAAGGRRAEHEGQEAEQSHRELRVEHPHAEGPGRPHCAGAPAVSALPHSGGLALISFRLVSTTSLRWVSSRPLGVYVDVLGSI